MSCVANPNRTLSIAYPGGAASGWIAASLLPSGKPVAHKFAAGDEESAIRIGEDQCVAARASAWISEVVCLDPFSIGPTVAGRFFD
ncbi:MAG: hypothetical protein ACI9OU_000037 [Candidatus Promineifilaceae bacterium]|jgi:hypothetical protein